MAGAVRRFSLFVDRAIKSPSDMFEIKASADKTGHGCSAAKAAVNPGPVAGLRRVTTHVVQTRRVDTTAARYVDASPKELLQMAYQARGGAAAARDGAANHLFVASHWVDIGSVEFHPGT